MLIAFALSYSLYFFVSERVNPFAGPKRGGSKYRKWKLGRTLAANLLIAYFFIFFLSYVVDLSGQLEIALMVGCFVVFSIIPIFTYVKNLKQQHQHSPRHASKLLHGTSQETNQPLANASKVIRVGARNNLIVRSAQASSVPLIEFENKDQERPQISMTEEHELELELAIAHIDPNLTDFDQSIAEAEFRDSHTNDMEVSDSAIPNIYSDKSEADADSNYSMNHNVAHEFEVDGYREQLKSAEYNHRSRSSLNDREDGSVRIEAQNDLINDLKKQNKELLCERDQLSIDSVALQSELINSKSIARKYAREKDHAEKIKVKALELAAMERKKRKVTEIKAQKAILRIRQLSLVEPE